MKVIFLDFDGVLNSATSFLYEDNRREKHCEQGVVGPVNETLSYHCCAAFRRVLDIYPEVKVVISSTWRTLFDLEWLKAKLSEYHIDASRVIGCTPEDKEYLNRGNEIAWWLKDHPEVTHYIIIDDNEWGISKIHGKDRFVQTDWDRGMGVNHAAEAIDKLSAMNQKKVKERLERERLEQ
jgi:HAD domain in Swiss Army Knife RNA repair proteins